MIEGISGKKTTSVRRILLDENSAKDISKWIERLRKDSCKVDASKLVNVILRIFFQKYGPFEYDHLVNEFFDKKSYLKNLINSTSAEEIDDSVKKYLGKVTPKKKRGRKPKKKKELSELSESKKLMGDNQIN